MWAEYGSRNGSKGRNKVVSSAWVALSTTVQICKGKQRGEEGACVGLLFPIYRDRQTAGDPGTTQANRWFGERSVACRMVRLPRMVLNCTFAS